MGFLRRLLGRPGGEEDKDAGLLAQPRAEPSPDRPAPILVQSPMSGPSQGIVPGHAGGDRAPVFTSRTYATEPDFGIPADADTESVDPPADAEPEEVADPSAVAGLAEDDPSSAEADDATTAASVPTGVRCPSCASLLDPPPERTRRCPYCREQIVVRRVDGRPVYLTEAALPVFEEERQRVEDALTWTEQRQRWLKLAGNVRAPAVRRARLAAAPLTAAVVQASRTLYLSGVDLAVRAARNEKRWQDVARIRREQAAALWAESGGKVPPPTEVADLHEEGMLAELRSMTRSSRDAELVSARCCKTCRADDGKAFRIAAELKVPRLPHAGCPKGICKCEWWPTMSDPNPKARRGKAPAQTVSAVEPQPGEPAEETLQSLTSTPALTATRAESRDVSVTIEMMEPKA